MTRYCGTFEAARLLGLSVGTVQSLVEQGKLEAWKTSGGHRRISVDSITQYLERQGKTLPSGDHEEESLRVLVVDDDLATLQVIQTAIEKWMLPIEVTCLPSAVKALLDIGQIKPHLLLTDLRMPGVDGFDLLRTLSGQPGFSSLVIVAMTALGPEEIEQHGGLPDTAVLAPKPMNLQWLHGFLSAMVAERRLRQRRSTPSEEITSD